MVNKPKANPLIGQISYLKRKSQNERALHLLEDLTRSVSYLMKKYNLKVGTLAEFYPKDTRLLGLNVNHGLKIMIRLRSPSDDSVFLDYDSILETMIHELTHNKYGPHDGKFYKQYEEFRVEQWSFDRQGLVNNFLGSGKKLGTGNTLRAGAGSRLGGTLVGKRFSGRGTKLGFSGSIFSTLNDDRRLTAKDMAAIAAKKRFNDESKLCHDDNVNVDKILQNHEEMESQTETVIVIDDDDTDNNKKENNNAVAEYIDLT